MTSMSERLARLSPAEKRLLLKSILVERAAGEASAEVGPKRGEQTRGDRAHATDAHVGRDRAVGELSLSPPDLEAEARLDDSIRIAAGSELPSTDPRHIFLTGATGFLGAFLLRELLERTAARITCLARGRTETDCQERIRENLAGYGLWRPEWAERITAVVGDLAKPNLGLEAAEFARLGAETDAIYHNGAVVNFVFPYALLKGPNVEGTREVIRLAALGRPKPLHYVSSVGIFASSGYEGQTVLEETEAGHSNLLDGGYAQTKWVADRLVSEARRRGLPTVIYRLGLVTGHSQTGVGSTDSLVCRLLKGCIQLGSAPQVDALVEIVPVDFLASAIVRLSRSRASFGKTYHLVNPQPAPWKTLVDCMRAAGYPIRDVPLEQWTAELIGDSRRSPSNAMYPLVSLMHEPGSQQQLLYNACMPKFSCRGASADLQGTGIECPPVDAALLSVYFSYFVRGGFVPAPSESAAASRSALAAVE